MPAFRAIIAVTAALGRKRTLPRRGDTVTVAGPGPSVRLEALDGRHYDPPEINGHAACPEEHDAGIRARDLVRSMMPGTLCVLEEWDSTGNRRVGRLTGSVGEDVAAVLASERLAGGAAA